MIFKLPHISPVFPPEGGVTRLKTDTNVKLNLIQNFKRANPSMWIRDSNKDRISKNVNRITVFGSHEIDPNGIFSAEVPP